MLLPNGLQVLLPCGDSRQLSSGLTISQQMLNRLATNILQLQEQKVSHSRLVMYWRRFISWSFGGLREFFDWTSWLSAALKYFGKEDLLNLLLRCTKSLAPPLAVLQTLHDV